MPATKGDERRERKTSRFRFGVSWDKRYSVWKAQLWDPQTKRNKRIGAHTFEEDAARAYDCAAVKMHGPGYTKRNFPDELISVALASRGDARSSHYKEQKRAQNIGMHDSQLDAAVVYDYAAVQLHGPDWPKLNFPGEVIAKAPESRKDKRKRLRASR
ncbi:hypothetical protein FOA52_004085 [Chlamydomonas sp. UWO 241]|nr:hypothetical protein FOA52_004085 [Chlamydomonas sp. UWO 241]